MHIHKISIRLLFSIIILGAVTACDNDFLDKNPLNSVSGEIFWNSESDVRTALAGVYSRLQQNFLGYERVYFDGLTDNAYLDPGNGNQSNMLNMTTGSISPGLGGAMVNMYNTPYRAIASANYFLANVDRAAIAEDQSNIFKAEVRFIRALAYFDLVQNFGEIVLYKESPENLEDAKRPKSTAAEVYAFIEEDLDFGISHLPEAEYNGHAVKGSAQALKARVYISQQKWSEALPLLEQVISSGIFGLSDDYAALFRSGGQSEASVKREILFSTQYLSPDNAQRSGSGGMNVELGWWSMMQPYGDLIAAYEMKDGKSIQESPLFDANNPYANRDPRLDLTVKLPGERWINPVTGELWEGSYTPQTDFLMEKYVDLSLAPFGSATALSTDQDLVHLRYADVLLMYAEAKNEASGPDPSVYDALNQVRARPGINMPAVDESKYNSQEALRENIRHERRIELALEGHRYFDLKRWNIAHIKLPTLVTPAGTPLKFDQRNYKLPLPQSELDNNPNLVQNPDYN